MRAAILLLITLSSLCSAQDWVELDLSHADLVVVGTLHRDYKVPWIDGWNERGHIDVERTLKGRMPESSIAFAWERDFVEGWCITRPDRRGAVGIRGIWVLQREGGRYRAPSLFSGFLDIKCLDSITRSLR